MVKMRSLKKVSIVILSGIFLIMLWYFFSNPASILKNRQIKEVGLYTLQTNRTLWDLGYNSGDFTKASPQYGDFKFNAVFKGDALNMVIKSLSAPSKSFYILPKDPESYHGSYVINIRMSDDEGFTFLIDDLYKKLNGRFIGYKYKGSANGKRTWIVYENAKLGQILEELRTK